MQGEQCSFSCRSRHFYTWAISLTHLEDAYTFSCVPDPAWHVGCIPLQPAWIESSLAAAPLEIFELSSAQPPLTERTQRVQLTYTKISKTLITCA